MAWCGWHGVSNFGGEGRFLGWVNWVGSVGWHGVSNFGGEGRFLGWVNWVGSVGWALMWLDDDEI